MLWRRRLRSLFLSFFARFFGLNNVPFCLDDVISFLVFSFQFVPNHLLLSCLFSFLFFDSFVSFWKGKEKIQRGPVAGVSRRLSRPRWREKKKNKGEKEEIFLSWKVKEKKVSRASHGRHFSSHIYSLKNQNVSSAWLIQSVNQCLGGMLSLFFLSEILAEKVLAQFEGKRGMTYVARKR